MIYITEISLKAPCSMPLCHKLTKYSIHDIPGREQTGIVICEDCLKGIVEAYTGMGKAPAVPEADAPLLAPIEPVAPIVEEEKPVLVRQPQPPVKKKRPPAKKK